MTRILGTIVISIFADKVFKESIIYFQEDRYIENPGIHNRNAVITQKRKKRTKGIKSSSSARRHHTKHRRAEAAATVASFIGGIFRDSVWSPNLG